MFTNNPNFPDDPQYIRIWLCEEIKTKAEEWRGNNYDRYCDKDFDALAAQLTTELDPAKRAEIYKKINDKLVADVVHIPLVARNFPVAGKAKNLKGVVPNPWDGAPYDIMNWTNQ